LEWSDLETWGTLYDNTPKDVDGNVVLGNDVMLYHTKNCIINMPADKLVVIQGLEGYIVVESDQTLMICRKDDEHLIRQFVNDVRLNKGENFT
jgi:mannose-1-phosphate guanylyltransferase